MKKTEIFGMDFKCPKGNSGSINPNWPSTNPGKPSGGGRGNNPPSGGKGK